MKGWLGHPLREKRARARWNPPSRCPIDGECLGKVVPPRPGERCECGAPAVVVIVDHFSFREPLCREMWTKP